MSIDDPDRLSDYLIGLRSVLQAGRRLYDDLNAGRATVVETTDALDRAAEEHESGGGQYRAFMFQELEAAPAIDPEAGRRATEHTLANILAEFQVADVLLAAGQATGEAGVAPESRNLEEALRRLDGTAIALERSQAGLGGDEAAPGQYGFDEAVEEAEFNPSVDLPAAIATFSDRCDATLDTLVREAGEALNGVFKKLADLDGSKVLETIERLGHHVVQVGELVGRLLSRGVQLLKDALGALVRLLGEDALVWVKERVRKLWQDVKDGKHVAEALRWAFDVQATRERVRANTSLPGLDQAALDKASRDVSRLTPTFHKDMEIAVEIGSAVALGALVASHTPWAGPLLTLAAAAYATILAGVVLLGMDYADSETLLRRIRGVGEIADGVRPSPAP